MDIQYRRDMNHTYMVMESEDAAVLESYETRIVLTNRISGLLPCTLQYLDNKTCFCYDTTSRQSLKTSLEGREITRREMQKILGNILSVMSRMEDYLLSFRHLVLEPEQIYLLPDPMEVSLCFAPFFDEEPKEGMQRVVEFLLAHTGKASQDAVILGSRFSHALRQPGIRLYDLERVLYGELPGEEERPGGVGASPDNIGWNVGGGAPEPGIPQPGRGGAAMAGIGSSSADPGGQAGRTSDKPRRINRYVAAVVAAGAVLAAAVYVFLHYYNGKLPPWPYLAGAGGAAVAATAVVIIIRRKTLEELPEEREEEVPHPAFRTGREPSPYGTAYGEAMGLGGGTPADGGPVTGRPVGGSPYADSPAAERLYTGHSVGGGYYDRSMGAGGFDARPVGGDPYTGHPAGDTAFGFGSPDPAGPGGPLYRPGPGSGTDQTLRREAEMGFTTILSPPGKEEIAACLVPENGPEAGSRIPLQGKRTRIGKLAGRADICADSPAVSRLHAEIIRKGEAFYIRDLNSRNGTKVNEEILAGNVEKLLRDGDRLRLADRVFIFRQPAGEEPMNT